MKILNLLTLFSLPCVLSLSQPGNVTFTSFKKRNLRDGIITFYNILENACQYNQELYQDYLKVAISGEEWNNGEKCGSCIQITGKGNGIGTTPFYGTHKGIITNICPECPGGHFDLLMEGDGIWDIDYEFVPCINIGIELPPVQYRVDTNNDFYLRLQIINTESEIENVMLENAVFMEKTFDNFWVYYNPSDIDNQSIFYFPLFIEVKLKDGTIHTGTIENNENYTNL